MSDADQDNKHKRSLADLRSRIDDLDSKILTAISERARLAQQVAQVKMATGSAVCYRPEREARVLRGIREQNAGPLTDRAMAGLFREIMSACLALEQPIRVAYLGPDGTFTHQAALTHFGHSVITHPVTTIDEVFREVAAGTVNYGVIPVENSSEGVVNPTLDTFIYSPLLICGEVVLSIHHHLLCRAQLPQDNIQQIYAHAQSLAQCRKWLNTHWPAAQRIPVSSNGEAARRVQSADNAAAIAGDMAAKLYGLQTVAANIEDQPNNATRFLVIGKETVPASGEDKTSLVVSMRNQPGSLHRLLAPFHSHGIDLTRIETRPSPQGVWNYVFFIDFSGHRDDVKVQSVLAEIEPLCVELKILGSYPKEVR